MKKLISFLLIFAFASTMQAKELEKEKSSWVPTQETIARYAIPVGLMVAGGVAIYYGYTIAHNGNALVDSITESEAELPSYIIKTADNGKNLMYIGLIPEIVGSGLLTKQAWEDYTKDSSDEESSEKQLQDH